MRATCLYNSVHIRRTPPLRKTGVCHFCVNSYFSKHKTGTYYYNIMCTYMVLPLRARAIVRVNTLGDPI